MRSLKWFLVLASLLFASVARAGCPSVITSPCTIESSGTYILGASLDITNVSADLNLGIQLGIKIAPAVGNVTIICDIFSIFHRGDYDSNAVAIYGNRVANVSIQNCNLFGQGLAYGIVIDNTADHAYQTISIKNNVVSARLIGIQVISKGTTVEDNLVRITGRVDDILAYPGGISVKGWTNDWAGTQTVKNNRIFKLENSFSGEVWGINLAYTTNGVISGNWVENDQKLEDSWAFWLNGGQYAVSGNTVKNFEYGFGLVVNSSGTISNTTFDNVDDYYVPSSMPDLSTWTITNPAP